MLAVCLVVGAVLGQASDGLPPCCSGSEPPSGCLNGVPEVTCTLTPASPWPRFDLKGPARPNLSVPAGTFFVAEDGPRNNQQIVELSLDGTVRYVADDVGWGLVALVSTFDTKRQLIYGIGYSLDETAQTRAMAYIETNPRTGKSRILQELEKHRPCNRSDMAYSPDLDAVFWIACTPTTTRIIQWNPQSGQEVVVVGRGDGGSAGYWNGLAYVKDFLDKYTGILSFNGNDAYIFEGPRFNPQRLPVPTHNDNRLFYNEATGSLFAASHELDVIERFDEHTGRFVTVAWPHFAIRRIGFCFVPRGSLDEQ